MDPGKSAEAAGDAVAAPARLLGVKPAPLSSQARDTALLLGDGIINVARRGLDGSWKYAISVLHDGQTPATI